MLKLITLLTGFSIAKGYSFERQLETSSYGDQTVYDRLSSLEQFSRTKEWVDRFPDIVQKLKMGRVGTFFVPTNEAIEKVGGFTGRMTLDQIRGILQYHLLAEERLNTKNWGMGQSTKLMSTSLQLGGLGEGHQRIKVCHCSETDTVYVGSLGCHARIVSRDIITSNGMIQGIDKVIAPPSNLLETLFQWDQIRMYPSTNPKYSISMFLSAMELTGLDKQLQNQDQLTVFAPSDEAFARMFDQRHNKLLFSPIGRIFLKKLLSFHITTGPIGSHRVMYSGEFSSGVTKLVSSLKQKSVKIFCKFYESPIGLRSEESVSFKRQSLLVEDQARVILSDVLGSNGVLHIIDEVIVPMDL